MRTSRPIILAATMLVGVAVSGVTFASGSSAPTTSTSLSVAGDDSSPTGMAPVAAPVANTPTVVTLVTGDQLRVDGHNVTPLDANGSSLITFNWAGDEYAMPASAVPYLGSTLDVRLFDVSYLTQTGGTPTVTATTTSSAAPLAAGTTTLDPATARKIGAGLKTKTLVGVKRISLAQKAGAPALPTAPAGQASPAATPAASGGGLLQDTLTVNTIDRTGAPDEALIMVQNVDDATLALFLAPSNGSASFSVPEGAYSVEASVLTPDGAGITMSLVTDPQFTMHGDQTITLDARTAKPYQPTLDPSITAPATRIDTIGFTRASVTGGAGSGSIANMLLVALNPNPFQQFWPNGLFAAPSSTVSNGRFDFDAQSLLSDTLVGIGVQPGPAYVLNFPHAGSVPDGLTYQIPKASLMSVNEGMYAGPDGGTSGYLAFFAYEPWGDRHETEIQVGLGDRTDYLYSTAPVGEQWQIRAALPNNNELYSTFFAAKPGVRINNMWNKGPMVPSPAATTVDVLNQDQPGDYVAPQVNLCPACRQDDDATLFLSGYGDSDPSHYSDVLFFVSSSKIRFTRNGQEAVSTALTQSGSGAPQSMLLPMLPQPANYELDWSMARLTDPAASTDTDWTFTSAPGGVTELPPTEQCAPDASRACATLPLLFINYDLALDHQSQAPAGAPFTVAFSVGYQQGAPAARGLGTTVSVSYDDGATWSAPQAAQSDGSGRFSLAIQHPNTSGFVSLRVVAHDGAGNTVQQTVIRAYRLTSQEG